jgi:HD-GYP domain-containing protein (c-di-GMP phosphodiesterase class II)
MKDTQELLSKIAALRQQLEQARGTGPARGTGRLWRLEGQVAAGARHSHLLDGALRQLPATPDEAPTLPRQLTARAHRLLLRGRDLLDQLRRMADEPHLAPESADPLAVHYRETAAMADVALRLVQAFPDAPSAQLRLCEGLDVVFGAVAERLAHLQAALARHRQETDRVEVLADFLTGLHAGKLFDVQPFVLLAEDVLAEAHQGAPLRFFDSPLAAGQSATPKAVARAVAAHSLTVAQVLARLARHDPDLRGRLVELVLAALLHDAGLLAVRAEVLARQGPFDDDQRRAVEGHARRGAELAGRILPGATWLAEAAEGHHERLDGTGYPDGLRDAQLAPLTRLLAVCDVYAALCAARPHRRAFDPRTALTDTLLLAERGALDRHCAERLLQLSFYPVGSAVELADGAVGVVVATHTGPRDLSTPARPVLALVTDADGRLLPAPHYVDLAQCESRRVVRTLPTAERRAVLGARYSEWA